MTQKSSKKKRRPQSKKKRKIKPDLIITSLGIYGTIYLCSFIIIVFIFQWVDTFLQYGDLYNIDTLPINLALGLFFGNIIPSLIFSLPISIPIFIIVMIVVDKDEDF